MDILVTGGNGFVGRHVVRALLGRGDRVRLLALPDDDVGELDRHGVTIHRGDICQKHTLAKPMEGVDGVLHLAAMMHAWQSLADYRAVNVTGTRNVCEAALAAGVRRLVHMSSSSVYGLAWERPVDESCALLPFRDPYPVSKADGDRMVQRMVAEEGLPAVIIRPDQIFGPGDRLHFGGTADRLVRNKVIVVGRGDNALPLVYVDDAIQGLLLALDDARAAGQVFNITCDQPLSQLEFLREIAGQIGAAPSWIHVPYHALYAAAWAAEHIASVRTTRDRPPITRLGVAFLGSDIRFSNSKARRELGYVPRVPLREGVRLAAAWYQQAAPDRARTGRPVAAR